MAKLFAFLGLLAKNWMATVKSRSKKLIDVLKRYPHVSAFSLWIVSWVLLYGYAPYQGTWWHVVTIGPVIYVPGAAYYAMREAGRKAALIIMLIRLGIIGAVIGTCYAMGLFAGF